MHDNPFTTLVYVVVGIGIWIAVTALSLAITIPFVGVLVRYRANYTPKTGAVRLDDEAATTPHPDASIGYFGMLRRVHRLEGWAGLYKGTMPTIVASLIAVVVVAPFSVVLLQFVGPNRPPLGVPHQWAFGLGASIIPAMLIFPMQIIINRAITTPHKLPAFCPAHRPPHAPLPRRARSAPAPLPRPPVSRSQSSSSPSSSRPSTLAAKPSSPPPTSWIRETLAWVPTLVLGTLLSTPLEVLTARLTLQRRPGVSPSVETAAAVEVLLPVYSAEPVMEFRPVFNIGADVVGEEGEEPYTGLLDCARKIVAEEGWGVLARAWWLNAALMALALAARMVPHPPGSLLF
ncbi:hypothetical protein MSAN_00423500 [Mycena sanguinolenta]|uniref:Mitochondrial carrier n=1 Tax=Mycena sanguinolenta TaxID=230812 RepID=A0A8H6ZA97_9AGAR|nr:hypothetical protein MSAN_00423500 [Mycena sanguinolenta]